MTLIRRASQLIQDLRVLGILSDNCEIKNNFIENDLFLSIKIPYYTPEVKRASIINAIKQEFKDVKVNNRSLYSREYIKFIISEDEITEYKMTNSYKYFEF